MVHRPISAGSDGRRRDVREPRSVTGAADLTQRVRGRRPRGGGSRPYGVPAQTGSAVGSALPVDGKGETTGGIGPPLDLSRLGTVHTFRVS